MSHPMTRDALMYSVLDPRMVRSDRSCCSKRRRGGRVLAMLVVVAVLGVGSAGSVAAANPYEATYVDDTGAWRSNCVWWAWQRWSEVNGEELPQWGNGGQWVAGAIASGYPVDGVPAAGSIVMTWESPLGHVAFVEQVDPADPTTFLVSEYGFAAGVMEHQRWMTTDGSLQFIHPRAAVSPQPVATQAPPAEDAPEGIPDSITRRRAALRVMISAAQEWATGDRS